MEKGIYIYCQTRFEGFHKWKDAPEEVAYLGFPHRHEFHVKVTIKVHHTDRCEEFITLKHNTDHVIKEAIDKGLFAEASCEMMALVIANNLKASRNMYNVYSVEVSEDGENGGIIVC